MEKCDKFLEYIGIAVDGDIIALAAVHLLIVAREKQFLSYW